MKQIFKIKTFISFSEDYLDSREYEGDSNFEIESFVNWQEGLLFAIYEISYQHFDFEKNEWVVLPNPTQPKIEGVTDNE